MAFKEKVLKIIVEAGEEKTIQEISGAIATRAFLEVKKMINIDNEKYKKDLIQKMDNFEQTLKEIKEEIKIEIIEDLK